MSTFKHLSDLEYFYSGKKILINEEVSINAGQTKNYDILSLLGEDIGNFTLGSLEAKAYIKDNSASSPSYNHYIHNPTIYRCAISRVNTDVIIKNDDTVTRDFKVIIKIGDIETDLRPVKTHAFGNHSDVLDAIANVKPPTLKDIFDEWPRFSVNNSINGFWTDPDNATHDADAWYWDTVEERIVQSLNSPYFTGFVSQRTYDNYKHEATVTSPNSDDDGNGLVIAHHYESGVNYILSIVLDRGGFSTGFNSWISIINDANTSDNKSGFIITNPNDPNAFGAAIGAANSAGNGWSGASRRIGVIREGDDITVHISDWDSGVFNNNLTMHFNLNDSDDLKVFKGPQSYGYCNRSQANSTFYDVYFDGGDEQEHLIDISAGEVYIYVKGEGWEKQPGLSPFDLYGYPRKIINPTTGKKWMLNADRTITDLN